MLSEKKFFLVQEVVVVVVVVVVGGGGGGGGGGVGGRGLVPPCPGPLSLRSCCIFYYLTKLDCLVAFTLPEIE